MKTIFTLLVCLFVTIAMSGQCHQPGSLSVTNVTATSAKLQWTNSGAGPGYVIKGYMVEYGVTGFVIGNGSIIKTLSLGLMLTSLSPNTSYDFYVKKICSYNFGNGWIFETYSEVVGPITFITTALGIEEFNLSSVKLFPNPTYDLLEISALDNINEIEVYNITGQELFETKSNNPHLRVDLSGFHSGIYLVKIFTDRGFGVYKIVVNN